MVVPDVYNTLSCILASRMTTHSILHHSLHYMNPLSPFKKHINMDALTEWSQNTGHPPVLDGTSRPYLEGTSRPSGVVPCRAAPPRSAAPAVETDDSLTEYKQTVVLYPIFYITQQKHVAPRATISVFFFNFLILN